MAVKKATATTFVPMRPEALASELGISGKIVRAYLRKTFTRPIESKNTAWTLDEPQVANVREHFAKLNPPSK